MRIARRGTYLAADKQVHEPIFPIYGLIWLLPLSGKNLGFGEPPDKFSRVEEIFYQSHQQFIGKV
jgi:hypothetical protein